MSISGIGNYNNAVYTYNTVAKETGTGFQTELQKAQNTDTFTRTAPADLGIAETQLKLDKVAAAGRAVDYSGMTKAEIYAEIENRYKDAFDDFYTARSVCITKEQIMILNQFNAETEEKVGISNINSELVRNARGYKGTSAEEIETEIKEKYAGKLGFKDQLNMYGELFSAGVLSEKYGGKTAAFMTGELSESIGGRPRKSEAELYGGIDPNASAFDMLMNNEYVPATHKEVYEQIIADILFGIPPFAE
ncbi:MAG: hypothetical protein J6K17_12295 [Oscillospiraceae bacterium]|nr:hypothetical protein [Oscillospiraceae bacterium]